MRDFFSKPISKHSKASILAAVLIVSVAMGAYYNSLTVPFVFDDTLAIEQNQTIRQLWPLKVVLSPPADGSGVSGRPLVNLSLALNYAWGGFDVRGYHVINVAIHALAGIVLFGLLRRTLLRPALRARFAPFTAWNIALFTALIWTVHPLQTETVTCVVQRTESLVSLCYLVTVYFFVRACESDTPLVWQAAAVGACLFGMASKEVMVTAPLIVALFDRAFFAGTFREMWLRRSRFYLALATTWLLLAVLLVKSHGTRGTVAGFGLGVAAWNYALTQCGAVTHYLRLAFWPHPLVLDYGGPVVSSVGEIAGAATLLAGLLIGTVLAFRRAPVVGFAGAFFFIVLAPSSSVVPLVSQTIAEHRVYLALAPVVALAVVGIWICVSSVGRIALFVTLILSLGISTILRNAMYQSNTRIWADTVAHQPSNPRAHHNLGYALSREGNLSAAVSHYREALRLNPNYSQAHHNLGSALFRLAQFGEAVSELEAALRIGPESARLHNDLASALASSGQRMDVAVEHYQRALELEPNYVEARCNLGSVLFWLGRPAEALQQYEIAARLQPDYPGLKEALARLRNR